MREERYEEFFSEHSLYDFFESQFSDEMVKFKWGDASPYYDSDYADRMYYISFEFSGTDKLYELMKHHKDSSLHKYNILKIFNITTPPEVLALLDIN